MSQAVAQASVLKTKQVGLAQQKMAMYPVSPMYSRPGSSCSQPPTLRGNAAGLMVEADFGDNGYFPSTPPLSTSGSTVGSPKSYDVLQTPLNPMFSGLDGFVGAKALELAEPSVLDWSSCGSPPITPGKLSLK